MHVLRSERLGTLWCGVAVAVCLCVEGWRAAHPAGLAPLSVREVLIALDAMPGPVVAPQRVQVPHAARTEGESVASRFPSVQGEVRVTGLDAEGWRALGLSKRQAHSAVRYSQAVGGIQDVEVLSRMRVLPDGWLSHYATQLTFDVQVDQEERPQPAGTKGRLPVRPVLPLEVNTADSLSLVAVPGVGPWVAVRILQARRRWGGFASLGQLAWALDGWDSLAQAVAPSFWCDTAFIKRRCADTLSLEEWQDLPGIGRRKAQVLSRFIRHNPGAFEAGIAHPALDSVHGVWLSHYLLPCSD